MLGAASVQLGPEVVALVVELHTHLGVPLAKVARLLRTRFGLTVTPGGLAQVLHRAARAAGGGSGSTRRAASGNDVPAHHRAAEALDDYLEAAEPGEPKAPLSPERRPGGAPADGLGAVEAGRPGHDQATRGGGGPTAVDLLPNVPGDGDL